jgi:hypothetical protein
MSWVDLPAGIQPPDLTVPEAASWRRCSIGRMWQKVRSGQVDSYLDDNNRRKVIFESLVRDRARAIAAAKKAVFPPQWKGDVAKRRRKQTDEKLIPPGEPP